MARGKKTQAKPTPAPAPVAAAKGGKASQVAQKVDDSKKTLPGASVGIDFGISTVTLSAYKGDTFDIIVNTDGERYTPLLVGYNASEMILGSPAKAIVIKNASNTITNILPFLGKKYSEITQQDRDLVHCELVARDDGYTGFKVTYQDAEHIETPEDIITAFCVQLRKYAAGYWDCPVTSAVVAVSLDITQSAYELLVKSVEASGFKVLGSISSPLAAVLSFHLDDPYHNKRSTYNHTPFETERVFHTQNLVVDMGSNTTRFTIVRTELGLVNILGTVTVPVGASSIDELIFKHFVEYFRESTGLDLTQSQRAVVRLKQSCEQVKRTLSVSSQAGVQLDGLYQGYDLFEEITRAKFDKLLEDVYAQFTAGLVTLFEKYQNDVTPEKITNIILAGGSASLPRFGVLISQHYSRATMAPTPTILKHTNIIDTIAYGAAKQAYILGLLVDSGAHLTTLEKAKTAQIQQLITTQPQLNGAIPTIDSTHNLAHTSSIPVYNAMVPLALSKSLYIKTSCDTYICALSAVTTTAPTVKHVEFLINYNSLPPDMVPCVELYESEVTSQTHVTDTNSILLTKIPLNRSSIHEASTTHHYPVSIILQFTLTATYQLTIEVAYVSKAQTGLVWDKVYDVSMLSSPVSITGPAIALDESKLATQAALHTHQWCIQAARLQFLVTQWNVWYSTPKHAKFIVKSQWMPQFVQAVKTLLSSGVIAQIAPLDLIKVHPGIANSPQLPSVNDIAHAVEDLAKAIADVLTYRRMTANEAAKALSVRNTVKASSKQDNDDVEDSPFSAAELAAIMGDGELDDDDGDDDVVDVDDDDDVDLDIDFGALSLGSDVGDDDDDVDFGGDLD